MKKQILICCMLASILILPLLPSNSYAVERIFMGWKDATSEFPSITNGIGVLISTGQMYMIATNKEEFYYRDEATKIWTAVNPLLLAGYGPSGSYFYIVTSMQQLGDVYHILLTKKRSGYSEDYGNNYIVYDAANKTILDDIPMTGTNINTTYHAIFFGVQKSGATYTRYLGTTSGYAARYFYQFDEVNRTWTLLGTGSRDIQSMLVGRNGAYIVEDPGSYDYLYSLTTYVSSGNYISRYSSNINMCYDVNGYVRWGYSGSAPCSPSENLWLNKYSLKGGVYTGSNAYIVTYSYDSAADSYAELSREYFDTLGTAGTPFIDSSGNVYIYSAGYKKANYLNNWTQVEIDDAVNNAVSSNTMVNQMNADITNLQTRMTAAEADAINLTNRVGAIESVNTTQNANIINLQSSLTTTNANVINNRNDINNLLTQIISLQNQVDTLTGTGADTTPPDVKIRTSIINQTMGKAGSGTGTGIDIKFFGSDNRTNFTSLQYRVNSGAWATMPANGVVHLTLILGANSFDFDVKDSAGNTTTLQLNKTIWGRP